MNRLRKALVGVLAVGIAVTVVSAGTFASFSASTTNAGSTFATGTLILSNQKDTATACLSTGGGTTDTNANASCDDLFALAVKKPGDTATVDLTLTNEGSIDGSDLLGFASSACAAADAAGESANGTGNPCTGIDLYVQEFSDAGRTTASVCHYGGGTATTCAHSATETLHSFASDHADATDGVSLGAIDGGDSRYLTIGVQLDAGAGNEMQGRQATFGFTWQLAQ